MKGSNFKGFGTVFKHNLQIHMKNTKYVLSTIIIGLILFLGMGILVFVLTKSDADKDNYTYNVDTVYVVDETGLGIPDYHTIAMMMGFDYAKNTTFLTSDMDAKKLIEEDDVDYIVVQTKAEDEYLLELITGKNVDEDSNQIDKNLEGISDIVVIGFQNQVYMNSGLSDEQIIQALLPVTSKTEEINSKKDEEGKLIVSMVSMFFFLILTYFMVLIYGAGICADVPMEKTSKLVEQLLMSVSPHALISGKILSMITSCILQFLIWIACLFGGIFTGDILVRKMNHLDSSFISTGIENLKTWFNGQGFTAPAIILAIALAIVGLVFYLLLAGLAGATLSKPEEAGNVQSIFVLPLVISYLALLFGSGLTEGQYSISLVYNLIPFTAAMSAPSSVLIGSLSIPMGFVSLIVSLIFCAIVLYLAAKIYSGLLFFNGNKLKLKDILATLKK